MGEWGSEHMVHSERALLPRTCALRAGGVGPRFRDSRHRSLRCRRPNSFFRDGHRCAVRTSPRDIEIKYRPQL